jgi:hypothetical protein
MQEKQVPKNPEHIKKLSSFDISKIMEVLKQ